MNMITDSLFFKSTMLALNELKSKPAFWFLLYVKIFIVALVASFLLVAGFIVGCIGIFKLISLKIVDIGSLPIHQFFKEMLAMIGQGGFGMLLFLMLLFFTLIFVVSFFYLILNLFSIFLANALDVVRHKAPRGVVPIVRVYRFLPFFLLIVLLNVKTELGLGAWLLLSFIKYYLFFSRTIFAYGFILDGASVAQAIKKSWQATANKGVLMCAFGLFGSLSEMLLGLSGLGIIAHVLIACILAFINVFYSVMIVSAYELLIKGHQEGAIEN